VVYPHFKLSSSRYNSLILSAEIRSDTTIVILLFYGRINFKHRQSIKSGKEGQGGGCCRDGFCENMPEASHMPDRASFSHPAARQTCRWPRLSHGGSASVITYLKRGKRCCTAAVREEREPVRETTLQTARSVKKEREEVLQALEQRFPCSPW